jgi:hypothetical protein
VVDASVNCQAAAPALAHRGVRVIMRYYSAAGGSKVLTQAEAQAIHNAGIAIGLVYQNNNRVISSFSPENATAAASYCLGRDAGLNPGRAEVIRHPAGTVIYFGVDTDAFSDADYDVVAAYFTTIKQSFHDNNAPFVVGVYGSGSSCDRLRQAANVDHFWLAGVSTGWTGTRDFYNRPNSDWHLFQNALEVPLEVPVDTNLVNPNSGGLLGAFDATNLIGPLDDSAIRANLRFIKTGAHALFCQTPGGQPIIHTVQWVDDAGQTHTEARNYIEARRMVSILQSGGDWSQVEVTFDNNNVGTTVQGYVQTNMLAPISQMP